MIESGDWYFVLAVMLCMTIVMGIYSVILFIAISPLAVSEKNRNDRWVNLLFKLLSRDREQNFTPREFIMARALLLFSLVALAFHLLFPV
jgi:hypothetical protein